jgi:hypothetical protein
MANINFTGDIAEPQLPARRFGPIDAAVHHSGLSEATLYVEAGRHPGLFRKYGSKTLVDFEILDAILDALPPADIKPQEPRAYKLQQKPPRLAGDQHPRRKRRKSKFEVDTK